MLQTFEFLSVIAGWLAAGGGLAAGALALGWYLPAFRQLAIAIAIAALSSTFFLAKGVHLGISLEKARQDAAEQRAEDRGAKARTDAEHSVGDDTGGMRDDAFDRDRP